MKTILVSAVALIDPDRPVVLLYTRGDGGVWTADEVEGLERALQLTALAITLPLGEIWISLPESPR